MKARRSAVLLSGMSRGFRVGSERAGENGLVLVAIATVALLAFRAAPAMAFPWSIDMFRSVSVKPLEVAPRVMPEGTLPLNNTELPMTRDKAAEKLHNPLKPTKAHLSHGRELFMTYCAVCHGAEGKANGPVAYWIQYPVSNLVTGVAEEPDGYIYGTIRDGGLVMPSYADAMSSTERWEVVWFLRFLQGKLPAGTEVSGK